MSWISDLLKSKHHFLSSLTTGKKITYNKKYLLYSFPVSLVSEIFRLLFRSIWSPALWLFIICGSEPKAPKKSFRNAATIEWYWMIAQLPLVLHRFVRYHKQNSNKSELIQIHDRKEKVLIFIVMHSKDKSRAASRRKLQGRDLHSLLYYFPVTPMNKLD